MKLKIRYIIFLIGLLSFIISFLWFGRNQDMYQMLMLCGLLVAAISFLLIMIKQDSRRNKLIWTFVLIVGIIINRITEPMLIDHSYNLFIDSHSQELNLMNKNLLAINGDITISKDTIYTNSILSDSKKTELHKLKEKINVYTITKSEDYIYYGLWGFLDVRLGISYYPNESKMKLVNARKLKPNWYH